MYKAEQNVLTQKIFRRHIGLAEKTASRKVENKLGGIENIDEICLRDVLDPMSEDLLEELENSIFEILNSFTPSRINSILDSGLGKTKHYVQFKVKRYEVNGQSKVMIQIINRTKTVLYEEMFAENEFLMVTNVTISH